MSCFTTSQRCTKQYTLLKLVRIHQQSSSCRTSGLLIFQECMWLSHKHQSAHEYFPIVRSHICFPLQSVATGSQLQPLVNIFNCSGHLIWQSADDQETVLLLIILLASLHQHWVVSQAKINIPGKGEVIGEELKAGKWGWVERTLSMLNIYLAIWFQARSSKGTNYESPCSR